MSYNEIREIYLDYMKQHDHSFIPSASLVPDNDPTVLYVNAGMFPLVPFLMGESHPNGTRLANSQRCIRTIDIDEVGDISHLTSFEMLGNWSLNDYFKKEAIELTVDLFVNRYGFDINNIYASVFEGNENSPEDDVSIQVWKEIFRSYGIEASAGPGERIQKLGMDENWWELAGGGPCGPCSEIFYDTGKELCSDKCDVSCSCGKYIELGNNVFMEYLKEGESYKPLGRFNVDFGGGLDRLAMISQQAESVWETDKYLPILKKVKELSQVEVVESERIIIDHLKAASWIVMDGVIPGRTEREYILRRLIRRAIRHGRNLGMTKSFVGEIVDICIDQFMDIYPQLDEDREKIVEVIVSEETKFNETIEKGLHEFERWFDKTFEGKKEYIFDNSDGFTFSMYETFGFPLEMSLEELKNRNVRFDEAQVRENHLREYEKHQEKSRTATKGLFKGGLADTSEESKKLHTATHLLLQALYRVVGSHVFQKGSNITPERLRLDFPNDTKLTPEQIQKVEDLVNEQIDKKLPVSFVEMSKDEAMKLVQYAAFEDRYGEIVKVYTIGTADDPYSIEICNGPHVDNTSELRRFKIIKQENVGAGIKRIKAILE